MMSIGELSNRLRAVLSARTVTVRGDHDFDPRLRHPGPLRRGAVLVLLRGGPDGPEVLLTRRAATLRLLPGDVVFPGGAIDETDRDDIAAALREASEEVGLPPEAVEVLGRLDPHEGVIGWRLSPVVGLLAQEVALVPCEGEVAAVAWVPLSTLVAGRGRTTVPWGELMRPKHRMPLDHPGPEVSGLTATILLDLLRVLGLPHDA